MCSSGKIFRHRMLLWGESDEKIYFSRESLLSFSLKLSYVVLEWSQEICFINIYKKYIHTTRNTFKRENFNMNNTEIPFCSCKEYLSLDINMDINSCTSEVMKIQLKYFVCFPSTWRIKLLIAQKPKLFCQFQVTYYCYVHMLCT